LCTAHRRNFPSVEEIQDKDVVRRIQKKTGYFADAQHDKNIPKTLDKYNKIVNNVYAGASPKKQTLTVLMA